MCLKFMCVLSPYIGPLGPTWRIGPICGPMWPMGPCGPMWPIWLSIDWGSLWRHITVAQVCRLRWRPQARRLRRLGGATGGGARSKRGFRYAFGVRGTGSGDITPVGRLCRLTLPQGCQPCPSTAAAMAQASPTIASKVRS